MEEKNAASREEQGQPEVLGDGRAKKELRPSNVNVNIRHADNHYLASFNHSPARVFHNIEQLLMAIEIQVDRLTGG